jgi:hypothetical protein
MVRVGVGSALHYTRAMVMASFIYRRTCMHRLRLRLHETHAWTGINRERWPLASGARRRVFSVPRAW